jgi:type IV/VI secretion system ImpK/VasF family protein
VSEPEPASEPEFVPAPEFVADPASAEPFEAASESEPEIEAARDFEPEVASESVEEPIELSAPMVVEEPKRGFFSRLFGRKSTPAPVPPVVDPVDPAEELARALQADAPVAEDRVVEDPVVELPGVALPGVALPDVALPDVALPDVELPVVDAPVFETPVLDEELIRTDEHAFPPPDHIEPQQQPFASVEDALPAAEHLDVDAATAADVDAPVADSLHAEPEVEQPRAGLFSRLFGRKSKAAPRPSLEIEVHEDRIEAAAHALDEVSGESFAAPADESPVEAAFASVDDALPVEDATPADELAPPSVDELRFAPPPPPPPAPEPEPVLDSRATLELEPFDPFAIARDDRATVETTAESRSTVEMQQQHEARSTVEVENFDMVDPPVPDFSDTLEIEEKTDEFAIPSVDTERRTDEFDLQEDPSETTGEIPRQPPWWSKLLGAKAKQSARKPALAGATVVEGNPNFLFSKFRAFYNEIIRFKHQKTEFSAGFATAIVTDYAADLSPDAAAEAQSKALLTMLELQAAEANWMGGEARDRYPDAQYAMAVLADELFTHMEWDGQSAWRNHLLEMRLYRTHAADLDKLLKERPNSHVARDLARVYLLVIAAGFQGKYRPFGLTRPLAEYRQRLFEYIHQGDALMLFAPERRIFPEAETRTLEGHAVSRFSGAQRWAAILVLLMLGYTVLAHYAWNRVSADLRDVTERIRAASSTSSVPAANASAASSTLRGPGGGAR